MRKEDFKGYYIIEIFKKNLVICENIVNFFLWLVSLFFKMNFNGLGCFY